MKPVLAISSGDPAGISPEVLSRSLEQAADVCRPVVFGHWPTLKLAIELASPRVDIKLTETFSPPENGGISVMHCGPNGEAITRPDDRASAAQLAALERAVSGVLSGDCDGLVTAPVAKKLIAHISPGFSGHTEYLAERSGLGPDDVTMVFSSEKLAVGLITTHLPMRDAAVAVDPTRLERTLRHLTQMLSHLHPGKKLRIGVAALNPHAGEDGLIGSEERETIAPFCRDFSDIRQIDIIGPLPADVLFREAFAGRFEGVVAMYHDQAMIPLKLLGVGRTVNVTMGLPFVRTSPDHGVAYDIARTGKADPTGMRLAIELAAKLAASKNH